MTYILLHVKEGTVSFKSARYQSIPQPVLRLTKIAEIHHLVVGQVVLVIIRHQSWTRSLPFLADGSWNTDI